LGILPESNTTWIKTGLGVALVTTAFYIGYKALMKPQSSSLLRGGGKSAS